MVKTEDSFLKKKEHELKRDRFIVQMEEREEREESTSGKRGQVFFKKEGPFLKEQPCSCKNSVFPNVSPLPLQMIIL
ncbi:MAG: hypothetical protein WGN25_01130 [Candidatus Electrothrix sp. GW3-4]|uniref:hypothetical protein n=1 Tax=Candidatus Electrothrix sp. GW3-4 TaxID=3126740 RepID=UPI0030D5D06F